MILQDLTPALYLFMSVRNMWGFSEFKRGRDNVNIQGLTPIFGLFQNGEISSIIGEDFKGIKKIISEQRMNKSSFFDPDNKQAIISNDEATCVLVPETNKSKVDIILVQPAYPSSPFPGPNLPVGLGYLTEQLEFNAISYEISDLFLDGRDLLFEKIRTLNPDYLGFSLMSLDYNLHYALINDIKRNFPHIKIIAGGPHISFIKTQALEECGAIDFGVVHEGEETLVELLKGMAVQDIRGLIYRNQDGSIVYNAGRNFFKKLDQIPFPKFKKFHLARYGNTIPIVSSRGCPFSCIFCGAFLSMGKKWRARSAHHVIEELQYWYDKGYTSFNFIDSNFFMSKQRVINLCDFIESKNMNITTISSDGMRAKDADRTMLQRLKKFGLQSVAIGIESANDDILQFIKKGETLHDMEHCMELLQELNISVVAFFIIGLPGETVQHVLNSFNFALKYSNIRNAYFFNPNPLRGTELYKLAERNNWLRATEEQIRANIGGMGKKILIETLELPLNERKILTQLAKEVSRLVELQHTLYVHYKNNLTIPNLAAIDEEIKRINNSFENYTKLLMPPQRDMQHADPTSEPVSNVNYRNSAATSRRTDLDEADAISTHLTAAEKAKLTELATQVKGKIYVEIGSYLGASAYFISAGISKLGSDAKLYCIDTWQNDAMSEGKRDTFDDFLKNTAKFRDIIIPLRGKSVQIAERFNEKIDFLFIDSDHSYDGVKADIAAWFPKLNPGAIVIFHDIEWAEGVQRVVREDVAPRAVFEGRLPNMYWACWNPIHLSVIIPTRNRAELLEKVLESLTVQTYPSHLFEVIVVDNGSTDNTVEVYKKFQKRITNFNYLYDERPGLHIGRHVGCKAAQGEILVYGDDDIKAVPTWLEGIAESFQDPAVVLVGGKILPEFESSPPAWLDKLTGYTQWGPSLGWYSLIDFGDDIKEISPLYVWGCNFSIRKKTLLEISGFHPDSMPTDLIRFRGDGEIAVSQAIEKKGYKTIYNPKASVFHWVSTKRMTIDYLYQRAYAQGISESYTRIRTNGIISDFKQYYPGHEEVQNAIDKGYCDGFNFHQKAVSEDFELFKWVTKDNYWDD